MFLGSVALLCSAGTIRVNLSLGVCRHPPGNHVDQSYWSGESFFLSAVMNESVMKHNLLALTETLSTLFYQERWPYILSVLL